MTNLKIGPGGFGMPPLEGVDHIRGLGLTATEVEFTYGVKMKSEAAEELGKKAKEQDLSLSVHAPYYINLASLEKLKIEASKQRIIRACDRGHYFGTKQNKTRIVFHPAFYGKREKEEVYDMVKVAIAEIQDTIKENKWNVILAPETTGKASQFGDLNELLRLSKEMRCTLCVDFAHLKARNVGKRDYDEIFTALKPVKYVHAHFAGIEYTDKGERRHLVTPTAEIKELLGFVKEYKKDMTIINESPEPVKDSLKTMKIWKEMN